MVALASFVLTFLGGLMAGLCALVCLVWMLFVQQVGDDDDGEMPPALPSLNDAFRVETDALLPCLMIGQLPEQEEGSESSAADDAHNSHSAELYEETVYLFVPDDSVMPLLEQVPVWTAYSFNLSQGALYYSRDDTVCGSFYLDRCEVAPVVHVGGSPSASEEQALWCGQHVLRLSSPENQPIVTSSSSPLAFISFRTTRLRNVWYRQLLSAALDARKMEDHVCARRPPSKTVIAELFQADRHSHEWLNVFLDRYFKDMAESAIFRATVLMEFANKIEKLDRPAFLGPISVKELSIGKPSLSIQGVDIVETDVNGEILGKVDLVYKGIVKLWIAATVDVKVTTVNVEAIVTWESLSGTMYITAPPRLHERFSVTFRDPPTIDFGVKVLVGQKKVEATQFARLKRFIDRTVQQQAESRIVFPSRIRFYLPMPGCKLRMRPERFDPVSGLYYWNPQSEPLAKAAVTNRLIAGDLDESEDDDVGESTEEVDAGLSERRAMDSRSARLTPEQLFAEGLEALRVAPQLRMNSHLKLEKRVHRFLVKRFVQDVLERGDWAMMSQMFSPDCRFVGLVPDRIVQDLPTAVDCFDHQRVALGNPTYGLLALEVSMDFAVTCHYVVRAQHVKPLWRREPNERRFTFTAFSVSYFDRKRYLIVEHHLYYEAAFYAFIGADTSST